jgi:hypothetical protein
MQASDLAALQSASGQFSPPPIALVDKLQFLSMAVSRASGVSFRFAFRQFEAFRVAPKWCRGTLKLAAIVRLFFLASSGPEAARLLPEIDSKKVVLISRPSSASSPMLFGRKRFATCRK